MINYNKEIKDLKGQPLPKTNPSRKESEAMEKYPKKKGSDGNEYPDISKLPNETVGNIILNCLSAHYGEDKKEGFMINTIAQSVIAGGERAELKDKLKNFLIEVLEDSILREVDEKGEDGKTVKVKKGYYWGWAIAQVLSELGVKEEI